MQENFVDMPQGRIAVQSYGGEGRDVLFLHGAGMSGMQWRALAESLTDRCRPFSWDLPGHGHSTTPLTEADDMWRPVRPIVEGMGLQRPLLVGHDTGMWAVMVAALQDPELYSGVVLMGGSMKRMREVSGLMRGDGIHRSLAERFLLGTTGSGQEEIDRLQEQLVVRAAEDWMMKGLGEGLAAEVEHSVVHGEDGTWQYRPTVETMIAAYRLDETSPTYPSTELYGRLWLPSWLVALTEGFDTNLVDDARRVVDENPNLRSVVVQAGQWPQYDSVPLLTEVFQQILAES